MKARGAIVDLLPALGQTRFQSQVLPEPNERVEDKVGELQGRAGKLLVRIERGGIGVISHAQRLAVPRDDGTAEEKRKNR